MTKITPQDEHLIKELGLSKLPEDQKLAQLGEFYETVQINVGAALEDYLNEHSLVAEFEKVNRAGDDTATETWLHKMIPEYDQIVADEAAALLVEIKATAEHFKAIVREG